jgi:hypothetical protein
MRRDRIDPRRLAAFALCLPLVLGACQLDNLFPDLGVADPCSSASGPTQAGGTWRLTAQGSRSGCDDGRFDGDFRIPATQLEVQQISDTNDPNQDTLDLSQIPTVPGGSFTLAGTVRGTCVDFTTEEDGSAGFFRFVFDGTRQGPDIAGDFSGDGPPGCVSSGQFRITVQ